jgi:xylan 1,4-beta-xylosidase
MLRRFENPILPGFHPDPSICRVGRDFYLVTSSFEYFPGVPIFHSRDLVRWRQLGHVLTRKSQLDLTGIASSRGIYAPTLRHHRGRFYLVTTLVDGGGNFVVTARRPEGPWSDPKWIDEAGFDPSLLFTGGRVYYLRDGAGSDRNHPEVLQAEIDPRSGRLNGKLRSIWRGTGGIWPEGAHVYPRDGVYYLFAAEGGTSYGHCEVAARGPTPFGPFEPAATNPILTHRDRRGHPIQSTGHADLVELDDGSWWAVFLGVRPLAGRRHHLGRETFLARVTWDPAGWPTIGKRGRVELRERAPALPPHPFPPRAKRDDFESPKLDPAWMFVRNPEPKSWSLRARPGFLRLRGTATTLADVGSPAFVGRVQPRFSARVRARLEFEPSGADEAGVVVRANEDFHYALVVRAGRVVRKGPAVRAGRAARAGRAVRAEATTRVAVLVRRLHGVSTEIAETPLGEGPITLEVLATRTSYAFFAGTGAKRRKLGALPTRELAAESINPNGGRYFTGVVLGMYATGNGRSASAVADFDWFELDA